MRFITFILVIFISACSTNVIDMTPEPTKQVFDLVDTEGDGVINARDKCPNSEQGVKVGNNGCGTNTTFTIRHRLDVNFDVNSSIVKSEYFSQIEKFAKFMTDYPQVKVSIEGHTSIRGSAIHNKKLSQDRALTIKQILVNRFDIASERITTKGYGFERILVKGNTKEAHQKNRRIVAEITSDVSFVDMKWTIYSVDIEEE